MTRAVPITPAALRYHPLPWCCLSLIAWIPAGNLSESLKIPIVLAGERTVTLRYTPNPGPPRAYTADGLCYVDCRDAVRDYIVGRIR